jgi:hypothetical protein
MQLVLRIGIDAG